jgi:hypothetical protein
MKQCKNKLLTVEEKQEIINKVINEWVDTFIITGLSSFNFKWTIQSELYEYGIFECIIDDKGNREVDPEFIKIVNAVYAGVENDKRLKEAGFDLKYLDENYGKYKK